MRKNKLSTRELILCSIFAALISVGAFIRIPIGIVPLTLQLLFSVLAGLILGSRLGATSVFIYIFIGLIGVPVFTQGGGLGYIFQPTFGYLIGFGVGSYVAGKVVEKSNKKNIYTYLVAGFSAIVTIYSIALPYLYFILNFYLDQNVSPFTILVSYCFMLLPNDIISCIFAAFITKRLKPILMKGSI